MDREIHRDRESKKAVAETLTHFRDTNPVCESAVFVNPRMGKHAKFMVVFDGPGYHDEQAGQFARQGIDVIEEALEEAGLEISDAYWTALCKIPKKKGEKLYSPDVVHAFKPLLDHEVQILNPQVILCLGTNAARHFEPSLKGPVADHAGKVIYKKASEGLKDDRNVVLGITPGMVFFDGSKQALLNEAFQQVAEMFA